jgi:hypothetical protein
MLSELEAVNTMLSVVGQSPVSSLSGAISPDVELAKHVLRSTTKAVLLRGFNFNREERKLAPDDDGKIRIPEGTLQIDLDPDETSMTRDYKITHRGDYLYNRKGNTYVFSKSVPVVLTIDLEWRYIPEVCRKYVEARASRIFGERLDADMLRQRSAQESEFNALSALQAHELEDSDFTMMADFNSQYITRRGL